MNTSIPNDQLANLHRCSLEWLDHLNDSVPVLAINEWIHARQKLAVLAQLTHPTRKPAYLPNPVVFGSAGPAADVATFISLELESIKFEGADPVLRIMFDAVKSLKELVEMDSYRAGIAEDLSQQLPYLVPVGLIPPMNHYSRWAAGDGSADLQSWLLAGPQPDFSSLNI